MPDQPPSFATVRELCAVFSDHLCAVWHAVRCAVAALDRNQLAPFARRTVTPHYDPQIVQQFIVHPHDYAQWPVWDSPRFRCCVCAASAFGSALPEVTEQMKRRVRAPT